MDGLYGIPLRKRHRSSRIRGGTLSRLYRVNQETAYKGIYRYLHSNDPGKYPSLFAPDSPGYITTAKKIDRPVRGYEVAVAGAIKHHLLPPPQGTEICRQVKTWNLHSGWRYRAGEDGDLRKCSLQGKIEGSYCGMQAMWFAISDGMDVYYKRFYIDKNLKPKSSPDRKPMRMVGEFIPPRFSR